MEHQKLLILLLTHFVFINKRCICTDLPSTAHYSDKSIIQSSDSGEGDKYINNKDNSFPKLDGNGDHDGPSNKHYGDMDKEIKVNDSGNEILQNITEYYESRSQYTGTTKSYDDLNIQIKENGNENNMLGTVSGKVTESTKLYENDDKNLHATNQYDSSLTEKNVNTKENSPNFSEIVSGTNGVEIKENESGSKNVHNEGSKVEEFYGSGDKDLNSINHYNDLDSEDLDSEDGDPESDGSGSYNKCDDCNDTQFSENRDQDLEFSGSGDDEIEYGKFSPTAEIKTTIYELSMSVLSKPSIIDSDKKEDSINSDIIELIKMQTEKCTFFNTTENSHFVIYC